MKWWFDILNDLDPFDGAVFVLASVFVADGVIVGIAWLAHSLLT